jgi:hypothetical protein
MDTVLEFQLWWLADEQYKLRDQVSKEDAFLIWKAAYTIGYDEGKWLNAN